MSHVLKSHADVLVVGADESSAGVIAEIIESACDVLLAEPFRIDEFDRQVLDRLEGALIGLKIVAIDMETNNHRCDIGDSHGRTRRNWSLPERVTVAGGQKINPRYAGQW